MKNDFSKFFVQMQKTNKVIRAESGESTTLDEATSYRNWKSTLVLLTSRTHKRAKEDE